MAGIAAVARIAGEQRRIAQVLPIGAAIRADPAGMSEPRHPDALAESETGNACADLRHPADDLVPGHERELRVGQLAVDHMEIGAANPAGRDRDQDLARPAAPATAVRAAPGASAGSPASWRASWRAHGTSILVEDEWRMASSEWRMANRGLRGHGSLLATRYSPLPFTVLTNPRLKSTKSACAPNKPLRSASRITARPTGWSRPSTSTWRSTRKPRGCGPGSCSSPIRRPRHPPRSSSTATGSICARSSSTAWRFRPSSMSRTPTASPSRNRRSGRSGSRSRPCSTLRPIPGSWASTARARPIAPNARPKASAASPIFPTVPT